MGVRRFLPVVLDWVDGGNLEVKIRLKVVHEFYTHFYTFGQWGLGRRMDGGFMIEYAHLGCTFNPFVVGSTPAGPTNIKLKTPRTKVRGVFFRPTHIPCPHFVMAKMKSV